MTGILFAVLFLMLAISVPISISLGVAVLCTLAFGGVGTPLTIVPQRMFTALDSFPFMAVPFFILAGNLMERGGISKRLIGFVRMIFGRLPASLACITTAASAFFGAISGSNPATVAAIGGIMVPAMEKSGYPKEYAAAVAATSGTLGVVIPPSIPMVTYAITASVSVTSMFMAGIIPGLMLACALIVVNMVVCRKFETPSTEKVTFRSFSHALRDAIWALFMPVLILGGIYGGIFTPTEASAVSCVYAFIVSKFIYGELKISDLGKIFSESAVSTALCLFVVCTSAPFAWIMTSNGIPEKLAGTVLSTVSNKYIILLLINLILLFLGVILETQSIILLMTPMLIPIAAQIGLDPIVLGLIIIVNTSIGMITPPMAVNLFIASRISGASIEKISSKIVPFLLAEIGVLFLMTYFPICITWLLQVTG